jgi:homopolymeric O-antigen transport system permease protein
VTAAAPLRIAPGHRNIGRELGETWHARDLLYTFADRDLRLRYRQTALGVVWVVLQPLIAAGIFTFVFSAVAHLSSEGKPYMLFTFAALSGWNLFSGILTRASGCLVGNSHLVSRVFFPRLILPLSVIPAALVDFAVSMVMYAAMLVVYQVAPTAAMLTLPLWMLLLTAGALGTGLVAASLMVRYRDVQYVLPVATQLLLYASPVAYAAARVPEKWRTLYYLNPLVAAIEGLRWSLLGTEAPSAGSVAYSAAVAALAVLAGIVTFRRMERSFADVI